MKADTLKKIQIATKILRAMGLVAEARRDWAGEDDLADRASDAEQRLAPLYLDLSAGMEQGETAGRRDPGAASPLDAERPA